MRYTIFDGDPAISGPCAWPSHDYRPINGPITRAMHKIEEIARSEAISSEAYQVGDAIWYIIWSDDDVIVAEDMITL